MPTVTLINDTQVPLHICLKQISPLHYTNSVPPNGGTTTCKVGRVWFTIQARIDRGDNGYDRFQKFAPIAAVTIGALSLGAGAVYIAGASVAVGGTAAAIAAASSKISATVATHTPTAKRFYDYAHKGQKVVQMGQVIGIGGASLHGDAKSSSCTPHVGKATSHHHPQHFQEKAIRAGKAALNKLLQGNVLSSA